MEKGALETRLRFSLHYEFVTRRAGQLACGSVVKEPRLGLVRVATVARTPAPFVHIGWADDDGPSTAAGRYHADQPFAVRVPGQADRLSIHRGLERAAWLNRPISRDTARLIAAHLHRGPTSSLYGFVTDGSITDDFFEELDQIQEDHQALRPWIRALAHYVVSREDLGPLRWESAAPPEQAQPRAPRDALPASAGDRRHRGCHPLVLVRKQIEADHALQLIDAAYALGFTAGRADGIAEAIRRPVWARWKAGVER
ncbi:hypothetical protein [Phytohabitans suffuscus]|uniref:Uncharacterized protein n=1 Tax=Phytohabitans suffuscus TaxID=624315 RepID=A0A6F8YEJ2_9ACTN|nr:hypothetical protein [Phytohabitans suffuscus]BCB84439.1 hypothetical protein Psuf_017520 [Phytohabitans suffuscus]